MGLEYFLGIDVGTTACKSIVFDSKGSVIRKDFLEYDINVPRRGWAEQDAKLICKAVATTVKRATKRVSKDIVAIGVGGQLAFVLMDKNGKALYPCITWMDRRAVSQSKYLKFQIDEEKIYQITGRRPDPEMGACKILWLKENKPNVYERCHKIVTLNDYINFQLTEELATNPISAAYTLLFDIRKMAWSEELLKITGISVEKLPDVKLSHEIIGEITTRAAREIGVDKGIPVIVGGPDAALCTVAAGMVKPGIAVDIAGTSDVVYIYAEKPVFDPKMRVIVNSHLIPGKWAISAPMSTTGGCLRWFRDTFCSSEAEICEKLGISFYEILDNEIAKNSPNPSGLIFLTSMMGGRAPVWNPNVSGVILGLSILHKKEDIARAILEGTAYAIRHVLEIFDELGIGAEEIVTVGGGAKSALWRQIKADVTGKTVLLPKIEEATALGAAMLAMVGSGFYNNITEACNQIVSIIGRSKPRSKYHAQYDKLFNIFKRLYSDLEICFDLLAEATGTNNK
jgi:xylulokinase